MGIRKYIAPITLPILLLSILNAQEVWRDSSFEDFVDGTFDDGGANMYVSSNGRIQTINRWDINADGAIDILCVNSHSLVEMLDMSIYWGNGKDYSITNHTYIPADGPMWATADDLNNDGEMDLVVANYSNGTWTEMESFVYYGGLDKDAPREAGEWAHYPFKKRIKLPSSNAQKAITGDFNDDGYKDIVFAFSGGFWEYRDKDKEGSSPSRIYWGGEDDFNPDRFTNITTLGATDVVSADFNDDGRLDLVFSNGSGETSYLYYGSAQGIAGSEPVELPTNKAHAVEAGDVNNDGAVDIIFACEAGTDSYAYLNSRGSFTANRRYVFKTYTAKDVVTADFNKDGYNDIFFTNHQHSLTGNPNLANRLIDSYLYYGSANGFSESNRLSVQTIGAWGANAADLNNDGWTDLLVCNFQEHYSYEVPTFIYWNGPDGFQQTRRTNIYEHGAQGNCIADFDGDGQLDILITSMMGNSRGGYDPSFLYYGQSDGSFSAEDYLELPGREAYEQAFADLDDDGDVDVVMINRGEVTRLANEAWIYWNNKNSFDTWNITGLPSYNGLAVQVADLDRNGFLDLVVSNGNPRNQSGRSSEGSFIYWGSEEGWPVYERTVLPIELTRAAAICDINTDGHLDLVFGNQAKGGLATIFFGTGGRDYSIDNSMTIEGSQGSGNPGVADFNKDGLLDIAFAHNTNVLIYYQTDELEFVKDAVIPVQAKTMSVADVDGDGWLDLICPYYKGQGRRSWYSTILLGGKDGFDIENRIELPTDGGTGSLVCDFNRDGYQDIFFYCHRKDGSFDETGAYGDHHVNSVLYWGSKQGYSKEDMTLLPSVGAHYDMGVDIGHIKDRSTTYSYVSSPYEVGDEKPVRLSWDGETPHRASLRFQLRFADSVEELQAAEWLGPKGSGSFFTKRSNTIKKMTGQWMQYRVLFDTDNGAGSPVLDLVTIGFED